MEVIVNGRSLIIGDEEPTLAALLTQLGLHDQPIAVAVNEVCVAKARHQATRLTAGDRVEIVAPMAGG